VNAALDNGLKPIICIGEKKKMHTQKRGRGRPARSDIRGNIINQLQAALEHVKKDEMDNVTIAYEPIWAIGTGQAADGAYAQAVVDKIRQFISDKYDTETAYHAKVLYGGSVDSRNIEEFIMQPSIDGVLVGGASLKAKEFINICKIIAGKK
jgi:triosephosphate isomerase